MYSGGSRSSSIFKRKLRKQAATRANPVRTSNTTEYNHISSSDPVDKEVAYDERPFRPALVRRNGEHRNKRVKIKEEMKKVINER
jgi:hypothetical protein